MIKEGVPAPSSSTGYRGKAYRPIYNCHSGHRGDWKTPIQGFPTTNHYGATGDGLVIANRAGAQMIFMDAIQFHPTGTAYPEQLLGLLVSEAFRGGVRSSSTVREKDISTNLRLAILLLRLRFVRWWRGRKAWPLRQG